MARHWRSLHHGSEYIIRNAGLDESQIGIKIPGRNINSFRNADTTLMTEREEELKSLLMRVKEESVKADLKCNTQKTKLMASGSIPSWQREGGKRGSSDRFYFLGTKITVDGDCSHKIKKCLLVGRKPMTNLDRVLKSTNITLPIKVHIVKAMVFQ
uniref:Uncharacterized protein n=1 Tax=Ovis aries TaxID=9940 RepID=A0AC11DEW9_SHEEP